MRKYFITFGNRRQRTIQSFSKKINDDVWEFRTLYQGLQYRLLAFWDKTNKSNTLVISTHGFITKRSKVPESEIQKAIQLKIKYFNEKTI